jgi:cell division protein ZipA
MMLRTILLIIGVIIILAIAIDGWRRKRRHAQFSRAVEPTIKFSAKSGSTTVSAGEVIDNVSPSRPLNPPLTTRAQLEFPELETVTVTEPIPDAPVMTKRDPRDIEIQTVSTPASANDISTPRPTFRPEQVKSANQVFPAHERPENSVPKKVESKMPEVITLTVMSINNKPFIGYDLIRALEANNLHFGDMNIYHRHKYRNGKGPLYFSVASVTRPGTLDPKNLSVLSTPGLALFMQLDNPKHDRIIFKQMLTTAHDLARALNGAVCDDRRVPLRESTIQSYTEKMNL